MKTFPVVLATLVSSVLVSSTVMGAAGVVEAGQGSSGALTVSASAQAGSNDALVMLLDQFQAMRAELEFLRGMVEEQSHEINRLQRDSMDRYTDIDARVSALYQDLETSSNTGSVPAMSVTSSGNATLSAADNTSTTTELVTTTATTASVQTPAPSLPTIQPHLMTEQQLYQRALDSLLQDEQYLRSISEFDLYLTTYPAGRFLNNAYYWKGQAYVNLSLFSEARDAFETIVERYPNGGKLDDAMYSLGSVYDKLGNQTRARELLNQVKTRFPNTSAANLADIYLRSMN